MCLYTDLIARAGRFVNSRLLWLLMGIYAVAAFLPNGGRWAQEATLGELSFLGERTPIRPTMILLAVMLFCAGLNSPLAQVRRLVRQPAILVGGFVVNLAVPLLYIFGISLILSTWLGDSAQGVLLGLAMVASMPIATSSAAWSQTGNGNLAVTLGLILVTTVLSPLTTPVMLHTANWLTGSALTEGLRVMADAGLSQQLVALVLVPLLCGLGLRGLLGNRRMEHAAPTLKLCSCLILLFLNYTYASGALPGIVARPNWSLLMWSAAIATGMCVSNFAAGWAVARILRADADQRTALMFGLGLNNNGAGLVMASVVLARLPEVLLIAFLYTLIQHVCAGVVHHFNCDRGGTALAPIRSGAASNRFDRLLIDQRA